jgi:hypothetical protein
MRFPWELLDFPGAMTPSWLWRYVNPNQPERWGKLLLGQGNLFARPVADTELGRRTDIKRERLYTMAWSEIAVLWT